MAQSVCLGLSAHTHQKVCSHVRRQSFRCGRPPMLHIMTKFNKCIWPPWLPIIPLLKLSLRFLRGTRRRTLLDHAPSPLRGILWDFTVGNFWYFWKLNKTLNGTHVFISGLTTKRNDGYVMVGHIPSSQTSGFLCSTPPDLHLFGRLRFPDLHPLCYFSVRCFNKRLITRYWIHVFHTPGTNEV